MRRGSCRRFLKGVGRRGFFKARGDGRVGELGLGRRGTGSTETDVLQKVSFSRRWRRACGLGMASSKRSGGGESGRMGVV